MEIFEATVEKIIFYNQENNYTIAKVIDLTRKRDIVVTGTFIDLREGAQVKIWGEWINNKKYGQQIKVNSYIAITPNTLEGIEKYLGSGLIKGIGPVMAERIVQYFGMRTIEVIENSIERLKEVNGIGNHRIAIIRNAWEEQKDIKDIMIFLQEKNVSVNHAIKIYKTYRKKALEILQKDPYRLAYDIYGIGFKTADTIALKLGVSPHSVTRAKAGILYSLQERANFGHTYFPHTQLIEITTALLQTDDHIVHEALTELEKEKKIRPALDNENTDIIYLTYLYHAEENLAIHLNRILQAPLKNSHIDGNIDLTCISRGFEFTSDQLEAIRKARHEKIVIITGGPGTGKTTITKALIHLFTGEKLSISLCAPTGRAAKRMEELTGSKAKTIHRLLEFQQKTRTFYYNAQNRLDTDVLIIDEASMLDIMLASDLFSALHEKTKVILIGDVDQLPSVGPGNVLRDLISSESLPCVFLKEIFRQAWDSQIIRNAHKVNQGIFPEADSKLHNGSDFFIIECGSPEEIIHEIKNIFSKREKLKSIFDLSMYPQVLCPMNKGQIGTVLMNKELQLLMNHSNTGITRGTRIFHTGDRVIQLKNNYDKDIYNGDCGVIRDIDYDLQEFTIDFDGRQISFEFSDLDEIDLAYAITIHKSQGSEYESVIIPLHTQNFMMLERNLIYTAITRAKKLVILIGSRRALEIAITTNRMERRFSGLKNRVRDTIKYL